MDAVQRSHCLRAVADEVATPAEGLRVALGFDAIELDRLFDGLRGQGQGARLVGGAHEEDVGEGGVSEYALSE